MKHFGSSPAIYKVKIEDKVPSSARLFLVLVLFKPTTEKTLSTSALEWGRTRMSLEMADSRPNLSIPVTFEESNQ